MNCFQFYLVSNKGYFNKSNQVLGTDDYLEIIEMQNILINKQLSYTSLIFSSLFILPSSV